MAVMQLSFLRLDRFPKIAVLVFACAVMLALDGLAIRGITKLTFTEGFDRIFQSNSERFLEYQEFLSEFGTSDGLLILIEGETLATAEATDALENLLINLQFVDGVSAVLSPFSFPIPDGQGGLNTLISLEGDPVLTWPQAFSAQPELARALTPDYRRALVTVLGEFTGDSIAEIRDISDQELSEHGFKAEYSGVPIFLERSRELLAQEFLSLNLAGLVLGTLVALIVMNSFWMVLKTVLVALTAVLWGMGALGWLGFEVNVISITFSVLILAISVSDAVHLELEQHRLVRSGQKTPVLSALRRIGPAALLTSLTTALAFASLSLSKSASISSMGLAGALAVIIAGIGCLAASTIIGSVFLFFFGAERTFSSSSRATRRLVNWQWLPRIGLAAPRTISIAGTVLTLSADGIFLVAETRFSLDENLRTTDPAVVALKKIHANFRSVASLQVPVDPGGASALEAARIVSSAVEDQFPGTSPISIASLVDVADAAGVSHSDLITALPTAFHPAFVGSAQGRILVSIPFEYRNSEQTRLLSQKIEENLFEMSRIHPEVSVARTTGLHVMSAFVSENMIRTLSYSLLLAVAFSGVIAAVWLRSLRLGMIALIPNCLPIAIVGATLALSGHGLTFTTGIALTLAFGIAVDDTIHVFNRLRLAAIDAGNSLTTLESSFVQVTPALVTTSIVLAAGLSGTLAASLPTVAGFGIMMIAVLGLALVADLVFLPALIRSTQKS